MKFQVRIFRANREYELEEKINEWLNNHTSIDLIDIKYAVDNHNCYSSHHALLTYRVLGNKNEEIMQEK